MPKHEFGIMQNKEQFIPLVSLANQAKEHSKHIIHFGI